MKIKTSEATPSQLNYLVAKCLYGESKTRNGQPWFTLQSTGHVFYHTHENGWRDSQRSWFIPSAEWSQGGPIIEREEILVGPSPFPAQADSKFAAGLGCDWDTCTHIFTGPTPLIAAMRCYVASKLGDIVDIPEELT